MVRALSRLLDVKPEYDWTPLNWYVNPDLPDNVINKQPSSVKADLMGVMEHIITEGEFISSILGMIALVALILIAIF